MHGESHRPARGPNIFPGHKTSLDVKQTCKGLRSDYFNGVPYTLDLPESPFVIRDPARLATYDSWSPSVRPEERLR